MAQDDDVIFGNLRVSRKRPFGEVDDDRRGLRERFTFEAEGPLGVSPWRKGGFNPRSPRATANPVVSGAVTVGSTLTCTQGTWTNAPTSYTYQWRRGGMLIAGATASTYVVAAADTGGNGLSCVVTAKNSSGLGQAVSNVIVIP